MQGRDGVRGTGRVRTPARGALAQRARSAALALIATGAGLCLCTPGAWASGSAQGPPPGPQSGPFTQCPAIGLDTSCEYLIDVASTGVVVTQDPAQGPYDGEDDVTVAVQNDTTTPLEELHIGAAGSKGHLFEFDGDGMCWSHISPKPAECPFSVVSYDGPDATLTPESPEAGLVSFSAPLQPGQYTYFSLETAPKEGLVAGKVDDVISTTLTDTQNLADTGTALSAPSPAPVIDQAQIKGVFGEQAKGTIEYLLYSNASCSGQPLQQLGTKHVEAGVAEPSNPSSATLENNRTYYWVAKYSGDTLNSPNSSACGSETMTFGTPAQLPAPSLATVLSADGRAGSHITVSEGTAVTDTAIITPPGGQPVSGRVTYAAHNNPACSGQPVLGVGGGGATSGTGPSTNALTLQAGTYYFQAFYSGSSVLRAATTPCGEEVLTVLPPPASNPRAGHSGPGPGVSFELLGVHVSDRSGAIAISVKASTAGTTSAVGVVQQGAALARVPASLAAAKRKCKHGFVTRRGRCTSNAPVVYGSAALTSSTAGTYTLVIKPTRRVLEALKRGHALDVTLTTTFQARVGGAPVRHVRTVLVKLELSKHRRR